MSNLLELQPCAPSTKKRGRKPIIESNALLNKLIENAGSESPAQTFHFNPSDQCSAILYSFAREHREDKSKQFKLAWDSWIKNTEICDVLEQESNMLKSSGYSGDPFDKMYASARYYYRKKAIKDQMEVSNLQLSAGEEESTPNKKEKTPRKKYESADGQLLDQINSHITDEMTREENLQHCGLNISPAQSFENYIAKFPSVELDKIKLKKIYKNRLFLIRQKLKMNV